MTEKEFNNFLCELTQKKTQSEREKYVKIFYDSMVKKYGNQFDDNGIIDEFIDIVNKLKSH